MKADHDVYQNAVKLQAWWRGELTRNKIRKLLKNLTKRKYLIRELVDTEEKYIRDLSVVISDFKGNLIKRKIITPEQSQILFSNIDEIRRLNELFFATIFEQVEHYSHYKIIFADVQKQIPFFKIYFQYFNNYTSSNSLVDHLSENDRDFDRFFSDARANPKYNQLTLRDYLIKPIQRLPKYVLIMKEVRKLTPTWHPDYANIEKVLHTFQDVNNSNNEKLNQVVNSYKISEIQRNLDLPHSISEPGVEFILEESVSVLQMDGDVKEGTLYLLTSELIVARRAEKGRERVLSCVPFRHGGEIMENQEHFYYKNSFTVQNGQGDSCTFVFDSEEEKDILLKKIYNQLMIAQQKNIQKLATLYQLKSQVSVDFLRKMNRLDLLPEIEVLGTEERNDAMFKYTVYIVEVKIKTIRQKLFLRYSQLLELQEIAKNQGLIIKNELFKTTWLLNHKPKKIQERKMSIQRFLKELLSKKEVVENGQLILKSLGLPPEFYKLPEQFREGEEIMKKSCISQRSTNSQEQPPQRNNLNQSLLRASHIRISKRTSIFNSIPQLMIEPPIQQRKLSRQISIQDILQANEINLGHFTRLSQALYRFSDQQAKLQLDVLIPWIENEKGFVRQRVQIACTQKVYSLIEKIAAQINLKYFKDFRLYLQRQNANRLLDDDQCLSKIAQEIRYGKYLLILKKMIYLTPDIEERQTRADRVRLQIVASQAIYDCKKDKYLLTYSAILRLSALVGLSQLFKDVLASQLPQKIPLKALRDRKLAVKTRDMVANTFTSFYDSPTTWQQDYERMIEKIYNKIKGICRQNSQIFRVSGIKDQEQEYNTTNLAQLASVSIINQIKENTFYGSISFVIQISENFGHILQLINEQQGQIQNRNCWLIIKYHQVYIYSISLKEELFMISYDDILKIVAYPAAIEIRLRRKEVDLLKLKTTCSFSIRELILYYKHYNEMIRKMEEDNNFQESIIEFVREYNHTTLEHSHRKTVLE